MRASFPILLPVLVGTLLGHSFSAAAEVATPEAQSGTSHLEDTSRASLTAPSRSPTTGRSPWGPLDYASLLPPKDSQEKPSSQQIVELRIITDQPSDGDVSLPPKQSAPAKVPAPDVSIKIRPSGPPVPAPTTAIDRPSQVPKPLAEIPRPPKESKESNESTGSEVREPEKLQPPGHVPLALPVGRAARSERLERMAQQADNQIHHGIELANRKAYFAARLKFLQALRLITQALDAEHGGTLHSRALADGIRAIDEAEDFVPEGAGLEAELDLAETIARHNTSILKAADLRNLTPLVALHRYLTFAQEQLSTAAGQEIAASMALHALGKLHAAVAGQAERGIRLPEAKAVVYYQACLLASPRSYMTANDLAVLLAVHGNFDEAEKLLRYSLSIKQHSAGWYNLSVVYARLDRDDAVQQARAKARAVYRDELADRNVHDGSANRAVIWLVPKTFAQTSARWAVSGMASLQRRPGYWAGRDEAARGSQLWAAQPWQENDAPAPSRPKYMTSWWQSWTSLRMER